MNKQSVISIIYKLKISCIELENALDSPNIANQWGYFIANALFYLNSLTRDEKALLAYDIDKIIAKVDSLETSLYDNDTLEACRKSIFFIMDIAEQLLDDFILEKTHDENQRRDSAIQP